MSWDLRHAAAVVVACAVVVAARRRASPTGPEDVRLPWWLWVAPAGILAFGVGWLLPNPPLDEDDWYFFAIGRWLSAHATDAEALGRLFSEYGNHREPIWRPVTNLWFGLEYAAFGTVWWAWRLVSALLHVLTGLLVVRLGRELRLTVPAARLAGALYLVHPALAETISWINAQETQVMVISALSAVIVLVKGRWLALGGLLTATAALSKEQGVVVPGLLVVVLLADGGWRRVMKSFPSVVVSGTVVAVLLGIRFLVLREADNPEHVEYLQHFASALTPGTVATAPWELVVLTLIPTVAGFGWVYWFGSGAVAALWAAAAAMARGQAGQGVRVGLLALGWLLVAASPALAEVALPALDDAPGITPDWNLRHLNLVLIGPALFGGETLARLLEGGRRWAGLGLVSAVLIIHAGLLLAHCGPYAAVGARLMAATPHLAGSWPANRALRVVEPRDTIAAAARFRTFATALPAIPLLVGEPRCGCARSAASPDMARLSSLRELTEAFYEVHEEIDEIGEVGGPCRCPRWRSDAEFVRLEGGPEGPFKLVLDR